MSKKQKTLIGEVIVVFLFCFLALSFYFSFYRPEHKITTDDKKVLREIEKLRKEGLYGEEIMERRSLLYGCALTEGNIARQRFEDVCGEL